jgi:hypothetical protein
LPSCRNNRGFLAVAAEMTVDEPEHVQFPHLAALVATDNLDDLSVFRPWRANVVSELRLESRAGTHHPDKHEEN